MWDIDAPNAETNGFKAIPRVGEVTVQELSDNFNRVKQDVLKLIGQELYKLNQEEDDTANVFAVDF